MDYIIGDGFKFSLRIVTTAHHKLPAIMSNFSMRHGGHARAVEPLPELALPSQTPTPDVVLFNEGLWSLVDWKEDKVRAGMQPVWRLLRQLPKHKLALFTQTDVASYPAIPQSKVDRINALLVEFATRNRLPLIDTARLGEGGTDGGMQKLTKAAYNSLGTKMGNARRRRRREPAKLDDLSTFKKRVTSNTYLRRLYRTSQQAFALAPSVARVAEMHDPTKHPATTLSTSITVLDEHNVPLELECKRYLSSREHQFLLWNGWSALSKQSGVALRDAVGFRRVSRPRPSP